MEITACSVHLQKEKEKRRRPLTPEHTHTAEAKSNHKRRAAERNTSITPRVNRRAPASSPHCQTQLSAAPPPPLADVAIVGSLKYLQPKNDLTTLTPCTRQAGVTCTRQGDRSSSVRAGLFSGPPTTSPVASAVFFFFKRHRQHKRGTGRDRTSWLGERPLSWAAGLTPTRRNTSRTVEVQGISFRTRLRHLWRRKERYCATATSPRPPRSHQTVHTNGLRRNKQWFSNPCTAPYSCICHLLEFGSHF